MILSIAALCALACSCSEIEPVQRNVEKRIPADVPVPEVLDMGPSFDVLWASANVGAASPWERGYGFAWGERALYGAEGWDVYGLCGGSSSSLGKYCTDKSFGVVDGLRRLLPQDDPATLLPGDGWRTPTPEEWRHLFDETDWKWVDDYKASGKGGYEFVSRYDKTVSLFIPFTISNPVAFEGERGCYWTSDLVPGDPSCAVCWFFDPGYRRLDAALRCTKYPVRAVRNK